MFQLARPIQMTGESSYRVQPPVWNDRHDSVSNSQSVLSPGPERLHIGGFYMQ